MAVDAVSFDAAGTLFRVREPVGTTYARFGHRHGLRLDPQRLEVGFRTALPAAPPLAFPGVTTNDLDRTEHAWWHRIVTDTFAAAGVEHLPPGIFDALFAHYATAAAWQCYDETRTVLEDLRVRGYRLCVISNFDSRLAPLLVDLGLAELFDNITPSTTARVAKPNPAIFRTALAALGVSADAAVHVGDDAIADVHGARTAGMRAVLLRRNRTLTSRTSREPIWPDIPVITTLRGVTQTFAD